MKYGSILLLCLITIVITNSACQQETQPPNIVYILADDLGYGDISSLNQDSKLVTPNIDRLSEEGIRFTDAHSGSAVCTPTRYGILTGRYSWRSSLKSGVLWGYSKHLIPPDRMTVASMLKEKGYATACVGKWHLGMDWAKTGPEEKDVDYDKPFSNGPNAIGFDMFFGILASLDMDPYVYIENDRITAKPDRITENTDYKEFWRKGPTGSDFDHEEVLPKLTQKAVEWIEAQSTDKPFFLYFPLPAPHTPILPTPEFDGKSNTNMYGDFVLQVDWTVGQVMQTLERKGMTENTLFIFTSDNGCSPRAGFEKLAEFGHNPSYKFRGHKADIYEGGHRVPFIARWPAQVAAGGISDETICLTDLLATSAAIVGSELPANAGEDSYNILPALMQENYTSPIREATIHHSVNGGFAMRQGDWKLIMAPGSAGWSYPRPGRDDMSDLPPIQLYNLAQDIAETKNLQDKHPEIVRRLQDLLTAQVRNGRSTPGTNQLNDGEQWWKQLTWIDKE